MHKKIVAQAYGSKSDVHVTFNRQFGLTEYLLKMAEYMQTHHWRVRHA